MTTCASAKEIKSLLQWWSSTLSVFLVMCRWWGLAPRVCLGEQERDPRICILCMFLLACTLMKVKGLSYYVGSRSQVWRPLPTQPSCGPQVCILSLYSGIPELMVLRLLRNTKQYVVGVGGEAGSRCSWCSIYHALLGARAPRNRNPGYAVSLASAWLLAQTRKEYRTSWMSKWTN